jgi:hypothetical protein
MKHNHLAIGVIVLLHQIVGYVWYSPVLFLSPWVKGLGKEIDQLNQSDPLPFIVAICASFLACYALSLLVQIFKGDTFKRGVGIGGLMAGGLAVPALVMHDAFIGISWIVIAVDALHVIVLYGVAGGILAVWPPKHQPLTK